MDPSGDEAAIIPQSFGFFRAHAEDHVYSNSPSACTHHVRSTAF